MSTTILTSLSEAFVQVFLFAFNLLLITFQLLFIGLVGEVPEFEPLPMELTKITLASIQSGYKSITRFPELSLILLIFVFSV